MTDSAREETVRRLLAARETGDLETALECVTEDVLIDASQRRLDPVVFHGHQGLRDFIAMLDEAWETQRIEPTEFIGSGDTLVVPVRLRSTGRGSGLAIDARPAWAVTFRGELIARMTVYQSKEEALAGLAAEG